MRLLLVVNSSASSVTPRSRVVIQKALSADHEVSLAETSRRGHATRLAQGAASAGVDVVVVLGGDGTLNEAANGLAGTRCALAALPGGSTNVFARSIGLPNDPIEATGDLLDALSRSAIRRVGLGSVNSRYFLFHTGVGYDAAVVAQVERRASFKRYAGHPLFVFAAFDTWLRHYDRSKPRFAVHHLDPEDGDGDDGDDDGAGPGAEDALHPPATVIDDAYFTIVLNSSPYTFLGNRPLDIAPEATLDRGLTSVTLQTMAFARMLPIVASALGSGRGLRRNRWVDYRTDLSGLRIEAYGPVPYQVDGDYLGEAESLLFRHEPDVLDLVLP